MFYVLCFTVPLQNKLKFFKFITHLHYPVNSSPSSEFPYVCIVRILQVTGRHYVIGKLCCLPFLFRIGHLRRFSLLCNIGIGLYGYIKITMFSCLKITSTWSQDVHLGHARLFVYLYVILKKKSWRFSRQNVYRVIIRENACIKIMKFMVQR